MSQVSCIGKPHPKTWDEYEEGCVGTFSGGYITKHELEIYRHGMNTVFSLLRSEFPPAEAIRSKTAATFNEVRDSLAACLRVVDGLEMVVAAYRTNKVPLEKAFLLLDNKTSVIAHAKEVSARAAKIGPLGEN